MKHKSIHSLITLLLLVLFSTNSFPAFSAIEVSNLENKSEKDNLNPDLFEHAIFSEEISSNRILQVVSGKSLGNTGAILTYLPTSFFIKNTTIPDPTGYLQHKRKILKLQLFPFHFFW